MSMPSSARYSPSFVRLLGALGAAFALVLSLAACSSGAATASPAAAAPTVTAAWVRPPQGMDRPAAGYLVITGGSQADALLGATSPAAGTVELHETSMDSSGMTGMHPISRLEIPAGATVTLQPGGYHLMLMEPTGEITVGSTVQLELTFEKAGKITVQAEVKQG
jgi:hypothetical protein